MRVIAVFVSAYLMVSTVCYAQSTVPVLDLLNQRQQLNAEIVRRYGSAYAPTPERAVGHSDSPQPSSAALAWEGQQAFVDGMRDPFTVTNEMSAHSLRKLDAKFQPASGVRLPALKLRGVITRNQNSVPLALLEIGGREVYMVSEGDEISFDSSAPGQVLKVHNVDRLSVVVEVGTLGDIMVVR